MGAHEIWLEWPGKNGVSFNKKDVELLEFIKANLSRYAGSYVDGREIIAESFSSVFGSGNSEFALKFIETCDSLI